MKRTNKKAFTLIELLIVIAIIAVLATVVILSLNPAELLRQSRDSNRLSDMATLKSAVSLYLADVSNATLGSSATTCYVSVTSSSYYLEVPNGYGAATTTCASWMTASYMTITATTSRSIGGTGWLPINFGAISSGSPLGQEPVDPTNTGGVSTCVSGSMSGCGLFYSYVFSGTSFKTAAFLESTKYTSTSTASSSEQTDGGNSDYVYESGTNPAL